MLQSMSYFQFSILALLAGAALSAQAAANARLGVLLHSPVAATGFAFFAGLIVTLLAFAAMRQPLPTHDLVGNVPLYFWIIGGFLSFFGVGAIYWLIPQMGVGQVVAFGLIGQLLFSTLASHFGWFGLPVTPIGPAKLIGSACLIVGVGLIQRSSI